MKVCALDFCESRSRSLGLCEKHYARKSRGRPDWDQRSQYDKTPQERFWEKVEKDGGFPDFTDPLVRLTATDGECWVWTAGLLQDGEFENGGYGRFVEGGKTRRAHRVAWLFEFGAYPEDDVSLDHLCRNRACVRPSHLEAVAPGVNTLRGDGAAAQNARKVQCNRGHDLTMENTYQTRASRVCIPCTRLNARAVSTKLRAECKEGHEFTPSNTVLGADGRRLCVACKATFAERYRAKLSLVA